MEGPVDAGMPSHSVKGASSVSAGLAVDVKWYRSPTVSFRCSLSTVGLCGVPEHAAVSMDSLALPVLMHVEHCFDIRG